MKGIGTLQRCGDALAATAIRSVCTEQLASGCWSGWHREVGRMTGNDAANISIDRDDFIADKDSTPAVEYSKG